MVSQQADDRHYTVTLGILGQSYTAEVWRSAPYEWQLLSVLLDSGENSEERSSFSTLEAALLAAEEIAKSILVG